MKLLPPETETPSEAGQSFDTAAILNGARRTYYGYDPAFDDGDFGSVVECEWLGDGCVRIVRCLRVLKGGAR